MSGHPLYLAKPSAVAAQPVDVDDVVRALLGARLTGATTPEKLVMESATVLRRTLHFDISGAYYVSPDTPHLLSLVTTDGLPSAFADVAWTLPLSDYDQVADLPYNADHGACYGDFFAPVVGAFGIRSWLIASLTDPDTRCIMGALLLGSRSGQRFGTEETRRIFTLAGTVSTYLADCISGGNDHGLASLDSAA